YFKVISDKTASLIETCCTIGAMSATSDLEYISAMKDFGKNLGISFQIRDDILDYEGKLSVTGKRAGGDIKEKKITLPLIYSLNQVSPVKAAEIRKIIKNGKDKPEVEAVIEFVRENNGIDYSIGKAKTYSQNAKDALNKIPDSQSKLALEALVDFVIDRKN
ncbi:MAG: polyprenyl synthetase family protein, partial [Ignavibacteriaceae bacterium]|nr:polyprenyl synthetase family protein [Ignavibacteriaceae bacterium]